MDKKKFLDESNNVSEDINQVSLFINGKRCTEHILNFACSKKQQAQLDNLVHWLTESGGSFPKLKLRSYAVDEGDDEVRGVVSTAAIDEEETVVQIPLKCMFTVEEYVSLHVSSPSIWRNEMASIV
jgi:hypothetical protein